MHHTTFTKSRLTQAVSGAMLCTALSLPGVLLPLSAHAQQESQQHSPQQAEQGAQHFEVPAGDLGNALSRFAADSGVVIYFDASLTQGKQTRGLSGDYNVEGGLRALLSGSGLSLVKEADGSYRLVERPADVELSTVRVEAEWQSSLTTEGSDSFTTDRTTIGFREQAIKDIPQSVSVLTRERLDDQNLTSLKEAMEQTTGVSVMTYGPNQYQLRARGYDIDSLMLDGSRVTAPYSALANTKLYDTALYDRIEVMRGPTGILMGSGEPSGTVNLVRKRAQRDFGFDMSLSAGTWDAYRSTIDVTGSLNESGSLRGRIVGVYDEQESFVDEVYAQDSVGYGTLEYDITPDTTLSVGVARQTGDSRPHSGLPVASNGNLFDLDRSTYLGSSWDRSHANATRYFADVEHYLDNGGIFSLKANQIETYRMNVTSSEGALVLDEYSGDILTRNISWHNRDKNESMDISLTTPFRLFGSEHITSLGASYNDKDKLSQYSYGEGDYFNQHSLQNLYSPHELPEPDSYPLYAGHVGAYLKQKGIYGQANWSITSHLSLVTGGRLDWYDITSDLAEGDWGRHRSGSGREFSPYYGIIYEITPSINFYTSMSNIFQPQTEVESSGEIIEPRTGEQIEAGVKGGSPDGEFNWHLAVFNIEDQNRAYTDPDNSAFSIPLGETRSRGFEAEISGSPLPRLDVSASYAYTDTEYTRDASLDGLSLSPDTPRHSFKLWTRYRFSDDANQGWRIGAGVNTVSSIYAEDGTNRWEQGGYTLLSAQLGYRFNENFDVSFKGDNLTDAKYYSTVRANTRHNYYGDPRNFSLNMNYSY
ncbi:TonB-dependent siderophore receptor [Halomonas sp. AOP13-D3-9]